jgi:hypothetical protein
MTLLATEIHNHDDPTKACIVFAADRRISTSGRYADTRKKILEMPWLNAGLGYFGLAEVHDQDGQRSMQEWLQGFIHRNTDAVSMKAAAERLAESLNASVPQSWRKTQRSGIHLAGFDRSGRAEFWFVRNIDDNDELTLGRYEAREEFQRRDAPGLAQGAAMIYRNGDIRPHEAAWGMIDESFGALLRASDFRKLRSPEDYKEWVRFKMEIIAYFYKKYHPHPVIARPIDVLLLRPKSQA